MKRKNIDSINVNRIILGLIQKFNCSFEEAETRYANLRLQIRAGTKIRESIALQAALITAVNCGKRAFGGGLSIDIPENIKCLLPWDRECSLNEVVIDLIDKNENKQPCDFILNFGIEALNENEAEVICNGWQAGVIIPKDKISFNSSPDFVTGGIAAGALGVGLAFLKSSEICPKCLDESTGISLWKPNMDWLGNEANGPFITKLPSEYWILGLGHLGQAYLWNIGLMPFKNRKDVKLLLHDFDSIEEGNMVAGVLSELIHMGLKKTQVCSEWLQRRGFSPPEINSEKYDHQTKIRKGQPEIGLCGFDNALARIPLLETGFRYIVECALGNEVYDFDKINLHTFPNASKTPFEIWGDLIDGHVELNRNVMDAFKNITDQCGVEMIGGKAIATSFVGVFAGALVMSELLRRLHNGIRLEKAVLKIRSLEDSAFFNKGNYTSEL